MNILGFPEHEGYQIASLAPKNTIYACLFCPSEIGGVYRASSSDALGSGFEPPTSGSLSLLVSKSLNNTQSDLLLNQLIDLFRILFLFLLLALNPVL